MFGEQITQVLTESQLAGGSQCPESHAQRLQNVTAWKRWWWPAYLQLRNVDYIFYMCQIPE